ncbi:MAG: condensation domain-containing protein [Mycobacterium sp.]
MVALTAIHDWVDAPGSVVSWGPSPGCVSKVQQAPIIDVPPSYQQEQHVRAYRAHTSNGLEMSRLLIPSWTMKGRCDIRAMTYVINSYLKRHDTYHSWFEFGPKDDRGSDQVVRHAISNPADIQFVATKHGEMNAAQWRQHILTTPSPLEWDCFRFGVIQREDHFTFYASIDHVHADAMFMVALFIEINMNYAALVEGGAPIRLPEAGSYLDYCTRQREYTSTLTLETPEVGEWLQFLRINGGTMPKFPLPLGDPEVHCTGDLITVKLMDAHDTDRFEAVCAQAGVRFIGGVFACAAMAERELTGLDTYNVITPTTTRSTPADFMTTGWFTGIVPISVKVGDLNFIELARAAQEAFDSGIHLANVPIERVLELAEDTPDIRKPGPGVPMLSYLDIGLPPLNPMVMGQWQAQNGTLYTDLGAANQIGMWVNRRDTGTTITVAYPDNADARESVAQYVDLMKMVYLRAAEGRADSVSSPRIPKARV